MPQLETPAQLELMCSAPPSASRAHADPQQQGKGLKAAAARNFAKGRAWSPSKAPISPKKSGGVNAPLLKGTYELAGGVVRWHGMWGMVPDAFDRPGQTSPFTYRKKPEPGDAGAASTLPLNGLYYGHFMLKQAGGQALKVEESDLKLSFQLNPSSPGSFMVSGEGSNRYGAFDVKGTFNSSTSQLEMNKLYKVRQIKPPAPRPSMGAVAHTGGLTQAEMLSAALTPRNRSERKRKVPLHLQGG